MEIPKQTTVQQLMRRALHGQTEFKEMRAEYSELRKIANKRIKRAQAKGELMDVEQFRTTKSIMSGADANVNLVKSYNEVVKFLNSKRSTAKGREEIRKKTRETLHKLGYQGITEENDKLFGEFMNEWRAKYEQDTTVGKKLFGDSEQAADFFDRISERINRGEIDRNAVGIRRLFDRWVKSRERSMRRRMKKLLR